MSIEVLNRTVNPDLLALRALFQARGLDIRIVGGAVRDILNDVEPHDIDLCTDAFPDEQLSIYQDAGLRYEETGLQHGTITVIMNKVGYEITSLRTESEHDGRHAVMSFTRDWVEDLSRRDLTINAMAMTFDGELIDPVGGAHDLENKVVRFVGEAQERCREDYLRILRYFRFFGRVTGGWNLPDPQLINAIMATMEGLKKISVERVWSEMKKILAHDSGLRVYEIMDKMGVLEQIGFPSSKLWDATDQLKTFTRDPVTALAAFTPHSQAAHELSTRLRLSKDESQHLAVCVSFKGIREAELYYHALALRKGNRIHIAEAARMNGKPGLALGLLSFVVQPLPVGGHDLAALGFKGPQMGAVLPNLNKHWFVSGYTLTKDELLALAKEYI